MAVTPSASSSTLASGGAAGASSGTMRTVQIAITANLGGFLVGVHLSLFSGVLEMADFATALGPEGTLTPFVKSALTSMLVLAFTVTAAPVGNFAARYGRRPAMLLAAALFFVAALVPLLLSPSVARLALHRALAGLAYSFANIVCPMYTAEIAPPHLRGTLVNLYQLAITLGILYSQVANYAFAAGPWIAPIALAALPAALMLFAVWAAVPESPTWLANRSASASRRDDIEAVDTAADDAEAARKNTPSLRALLSDPSAQRRLTIGAMLGAAQQLSGINAVIFFAPALVGDVLNWHGGRSSLLAAAVIGAVNVAATFVAVAVADRLPRRALLLAGGPPMMTALVALGAMRSGVVDTHAPLALASLFIFVASFAMTYGPLPFVIAAEIFPLHYKALGMSFCTFILGICSMTVGLTFLPMLNALGGSVYFFYACCIALSTLFIWARVPETRNLTLEQIDELLENKQPLEKTQIPA